MKRIQSKQLIMNRITSIFLTFLLFSLKSFGQSGLHFSAEELAIWRQRAGLSSGQTLYKSTGDVSSYSPGDWDRILADALTAVSNSANDRFTNYDTSKGLNSPITELSAASNRKSEVDDREPRPNINSRDYGALSIQNAGFVYQMIGGDGGNISGKKGTEFANAVRTEMLWYASNQWLDFTNSNRWSLSKPFYDRNPGFFIACWLNTVVNAYDYTRGSSVYSSSEKAKIETWLLNASKFYFSMLTKYTTLVFPNYASNEYSVTTNSWPDNVRGEAWSGSPYTSYGINESYSNRTTAMWRFVMRASILLKNNSSHGSQAKAQISASKRWVKEWIVFGTFSDGTFADSHRGDTSYPQKGLSYTSVALGSIVDMIDAYVRNQQSDSDYENLYDWQLKPGTSEYNKYFPSSTSSRAWRKSIELSEPKGIKKIITTYLKHFDGSYGNTRRWGTYNIDGYSAPSSTPRKIEMDRWVALANIYYQDNYIKSIYTRTASGTRGYSSNPTSAGSYPINIGSWGSHPGTLFMFGQMEGKVWPYSGSSSKPVTDTKILNVASSLSFGSVVLGESVSKDLIIQNTGNSTLTISKVSSNNNQFVCSYSGSIAAGASVTVSVTYQPTTEGAQTGEIEITSDKTSGNNVITLSGTGTLDLSNENTKTVHKIEAENSGFTVLVDSGSKSSIEKTEDNSSFLSDSKAIKLYDNGDKVRYTFSLPEEGIFQLHVRVRSGNVTNSTAYWPDAYSFSLDANSLAMNGDVSTVSGQDYNFGTSYWGTMKSTSMSLVAGNHTLDIEALSTWGLIDYIEVIQVGADDDGGGEDIDYNFDYNISTWFNNKKSAVSITFDDCYYNQFTLAQPVLDERDIDGTFFVTTNFINETKWEYMRKAYSLGHEIASHAVSHPDLTDLSTDLIKHEIGTSKQLIEANIPGNECITIAWPYGQQNENVRNIANSYGYIGARIAGGGQTSATPLSEAGFYYRIRTEVIYDYTTTAEFESALNGAINNGNWLTYLYHGIEGEGWKPLPISVFTAHMDALKSKSSSVWTAPFKDVLRYYQERESASMSLVSATTNEIVLSLKDGLSDNDVYNFPLTATINLPSGFKVLSVVQNNKAVDFTQSGDKLVFNAVPDKGNISVSTEESSSKPETKILNVASSIEFGEVNVGESITKTLTLSNTGNSDLTISKVTSANDAFSSSFSGVIAAGESVDVEISLLSDEAGELSSELTIVSDKTEGNSSVTLTALVISNDTSVTTYSVKLEAEDIYVAKTDVGSKSKVSESDETSAFLSGETAVRLYDSGDAVSLPFNIPADGTYTVNVRLRSGDRTSSTSYFESAYNFELNGNSTALKGIYDSVSEEDESFGVSYWGTMTTGEIVLSKGENVLIVISKMNWVLVDYIEIIGESEFPISVAVSETEIDFEEVELDQIATKTVTIENTGMVTLNISSTEIPEGFTGEWSGEIASGEKVEVTIGFNPSEEKSYSGEFKIFVGEEVIETISLTGIGKTPEKYTELLEAELNYEVVTNSGSKSNVETADEESTMLSNNQAVKLYDAGDKVKIDFSVPRTTTYILKIRLRAGNYLNTSSYIPTGYVYSVDGEKAEFAIEDGSISALDESFGKSTWGTVVSNLISLDEGEHTLEVEALISWSLIDYIEIIEVDNASLKESEASSTLASELTSEDLNNLNVSVYPNPTSDILKVSLDSNTDEYGEIILMDSFGKVVYSEDVTSFDSETIINVTNFTKGFYLLNVQIGGVKNVKRVMIK